MIGSSEEPGGAPASNWMYGPLSVRNPSATAGPGGARIETITAKVPGTTHRRTARADIGSPFRRVQAAGAAELAGRPPGASPRLPSEIRLVKPGAPRPDHREALSLSP